MHSEHGKAVSCIGGGTISLKLVIQKVFFKPKLSFLAVTSAAGSIEGFSSCSLTSYHLQKIHVQKHKEELMLTTN